MFKVLITDKLSEQGMEIFKKEKDFQTEEHFGKTPEDLKKILPEFDAWVIRSGTTVTADLIQAATKMKIKKNHNSNDKERTYLTICISLFIIRTKTFNN